MQIPKHITALPSHYDEKASHYDDFNVSYTRPINELVEKIFRKHKVKSVVDVTCGTGLQVFWLHDRGFSVAGSDISKKMLAVAKAKARKQKANIKLVLADMRTVRLGTFDGAIAMSSAVGHLTKRDFEIAIRNVAKNLKPGGIFIFDIFNLEFLRHKDNITKLTIDWISKTADKTTRVVQHSMVGEDGVKASYTTVIEESKGNKPKVSTNSQTLQVYSKAQLKDMLERNGFQVIQQCAMDGKPADPTRARQIVTVARRK